MERSLELLPVSWARFWLLRMLNSVPFGASAMNLTGLGTDRLRLKLRVMSDQDLWTLFVHHREKCSREFWEEVENRKALALCPKTVHSGLCETSGDIFAHEALATIPT
jgi:hypothetical protein